MFLKAGERNKKITVISDVIRDIRFFTWGRMDYICYIRMTFTKKCWTPYAMAARKRDFVGRCALSAALRII